MSQETQPNKKRTRSLVFGVILLLIACVLLFFQIRSNKSEEPEAYQPIEEFEEAYEALQPEKESEETYDLEKTIRVINGLEIAQYRLGSFDDFLSYMARQDYSDVPAEVLEAKKMMMPVLQKLYLLQKEHEELNLWTALAQKLGNDVIDNEINAGDLGLFAIDEGIGGLMIMSKTARFIFEQYQHEQKLKGELKQQIQEVEDEYLNYLETFTPIFVKYMKEWDRLCIDKDKAYIDLYNNKPEMVIEDCEKILINYPDNRETLLLKSLGHIQVSRYFDDENLMKFSLEDDSLRISQKDSHLAEAQTLLDNYLELYPDQAAPALLLQGMIQEYKGNQDKALVLYDQSSVEYPRQAEHLTDMLDSYRTRTYLNHSLEGNYLLNLYKSIMSGFGFFSPNLIKALHYDETGDYTNCSKEIYNHFFRRSNQGTYDCLLLDMQFCEEHLPNSFNRLLPEKNYINLSFEKRSKMLGLTSDKMAMDVTIDNKADIDLVNLRVFLCIHFTDMYANDYYVIKLPTINRVPVLSSAKVENVALNYLGKSFNDISKVRAIAMTDDKICWIDNVYNISDNIDYNVAHSINYQTISTALDSVAIRSRDSYFAAIEKNDAMFKASIMDNTRVEFIEQKNMLKTKTSISIELPRELILLSPNFSWEQTLTPTESYLKGSYIHISFDCPLPESGTLYMVSDYLNYAIDIQMKGDQPTVVSVRDF